MRARSQSLGNDHRGAENGSRDGADDSEGLSAEVDTAASGASARRRRGGRGRGADARGASGADTLWEGTVSEGGGAALLLSGGLELASGVRGDVLCDLLYLGDDGAAAVVAVDRLGDAV